MKFFTFGLMLSLNLVSSIAFSYQHTVDFEEYQNCRFERSNCWNDFRPYPLLENFRFEAKVGVETRLDEIVFICENEDGDEEEIEIESHPEWLDDGAEWKSSDYSNPCLGRLRKIAVRGYTVPFDDDPALFTVFGW